MEKYKHLDHYEQLYDNIMDNLDKNGQKSLIFQDWTKKK